jgi:hypothetical protein
MPTGIREVPFEPRACRQTDNVPYVMERVGHDDEATTTRIYRDLIRQRREHGAAFDHIVARAREGFGGPPKAPLIVGWRGKKRRCATSRPFPRTRKGPLLRALSQRARQDSNL